MNKLVIGSLTFAQSANAENFRLESCSIFRETALDFGSLAFDTLTAEVYTTTAGSTLAALPNNTPILIYRDDVIYARFTKQSVSRIGANTYTIQGQSPLGVLAGMSHPGGIYAGQTVEQVVREICGSIPVIVKSILAGMKVYGYLPYTEPPESSARDNLAQVLFAIGAHLGTDLNGVLRVEPLWDGIASEVGTTYSDGRIQYDAPVSAVSVTEHQYIESNEETELFKGTAEYGHLVKFSAPMHHLSASGFTILESGANYARISAGEGILTGKTYAHNTRIVSRTVTPGANDNIKSVTDATLVSVFNSNAIANRLADFYKFRSHIAEGIVPTAQKPGHCIQIYDPYDKKMVKGCIESLDTTLSNTLKSNAQVTIGFTPPNPEDIEYYNHQITLTGSGTWTVPNGTTSITVVLIGGGQGGYCGAPGGDSTVEQISWSHVAGDGLLTFQSSGYWGRGGAGGTPGKGGSGGKIYQADLTVYAGQKIVYACGDGGAGAAYNASSQSTPGSLGKDTTFGTLSSKSGSSSGNGYTDPTTGKKYAQSGKQGIAGGDGAGRNENGDLAEIEGFVPKLAGSVVDEEGKKWSGGTTTIKSNGTIDGKGDDATFDEKADYSKGAVGAYVSCSMGSGAAVGAAGQSSSAYGTYSVKRIASRDTVTITARAAAVPGLAGANASINPKVPSGYGTGGTGGHGGGGASAPGYAYTERTGTVTGNVNASSTEGATSKGGSGTAGGAGAPGCIILLYREAVKKDRGQFVSKDRQFLDKYGRRLIV